MMLSALGAAAFLGTSDAQALTIKPNGELELTVNLQFPPTQEKLNILKEQMQKLQRHFCDVTDARVKLNRVNVVAGDNTDGKSDIWWFEKGGRAYMGGGKIVLFGNGPIRADVLAHELGHLLLGVGDGYSEQQRSGACGIGTNIDVPTPSENTVMQQAQANQCRDAAGLTPRDYDSRLLAPACLNDAECKRYTSATWGTFGTCAYPELSSELATPLNHDPLRGSGAAQCPAAFPGRLFNLSASLLRKSPSGPLFPTLACSGSATPVRTAATCPDGTTPLVDGLDLTTLATADATSDLRGSQDVLDAVGHVTGIFSQRVGDSFHRVRYFMRSYGQNPTTLGNIWTLAFAADAEDFGGAEGDLVELGRFNLTFDAATKKLSQINLRAVDAQGRDVVTQAYPSISLGGTVPNLFGAPTTDALGHVIQGQLQGTGAFVKGPNSGVVAPEVELELHLAGIEDSPLMAETGGAYYSRFHYGIGHTGIWNAPGVPQRGVCTEVDLCQASWNAQTSQFETAHQSLWYARHGKPVKSDWEEARDKLVSGWKVTAFDVPNKVDAAIPIMDDCGGPLAFNVGDFTIPDQVMVVLDRSGSMTEAANMSLGGSETRLEYAQAAARAYVRLAAKCSPVAPATTCTGSVSTGLISFSDAASVDIDLTSIGTSPGDTLLADFDTAIDGLTAGGATAIGTALRVAGERIDAASGKVKAVLLMSDGENNRPRDDSDDPATVAQQLKDRGIQVFPMPVGSVGDRSLFENLAEITGGDLLDAPSAYELPQVFFEAFARTRGEALTLIRTPITVEKAVQIGQAKATLLERAVAWAREAFVPTAHAESVQESQPVGFYVERGGAGLNLLLSVREMPSRDWKPEYRLVAPDGRVVLTEASSGVVKDGFFHLLRVNDPMEGEWSLVVSGEAGAGIQRSYVAVHVENSGPECLADAVVTKEQDRVTITVSAAFEGGIESGVSYAGWVKRPDGSYRQLDFEPITWGTGAVVTLGASELPYRGTYGVLVTCDVAEGAKEHPGESIFSDPGAEPEDLGVEPFERSVSVDFSITTGPYPPQCQPENDTDNDGLPDVCDDDADADDIPDSVDPEPRTPGDGFGLGLPPGCVGSPTSACCRADQTRVAGTSGADFLAAGPEVPYCVIAREGDDFVVTRGKADTAWGGDGDDALLSREGNDALIGGAGDDFLSGGKRGALAAYGGDGDDLLSGIQALSAVLTGGRGDDFILGSDGDDVIRPGGGADDVVGGYGDDTVLVVDVCELVSGEYLHGGRGTDTLVTPLSRAELEARGVSVVSFENIVIDTSRSQLAECP